MLGFAQLCQHIKIGYVFEIKIGFLPESVFVFNDNRIKDSP